MSLTIDAIIMDEAQMLIFYTIESDHNYPTINLSNIKLKSQTGEELDVDGLSYGSHGEVMKGEKVSGQIKIIYSDKEVIPEKFNFETGV
ncbi:hypothetical protein, partial [Staphylococcus shinii]|uniref:hypothetical protein n=1 Tax=Staphylococcus shinii TaxID=2912228 RepID=UPI003CEF0100